MTQDNHSIKYSRNDHEYKKIDLFVLDLCHQHFVDLAFIQIKDLE